MARRVNPAMSPKAMALADRPGSGARPANRAAILLGYVLLTSVLGLLTWNPVGWMIFPRVFTAVWAGSPAADVIFVVGTAGAGVLGYWLARSFHMAAAALAAFAVESIVFTASYWMLPGDFFSTGEEWLEIFPQRRLLDVLQFVVYLGAPGLVFASLAPPALVLRERAKDRRRQETVSASGGERGFGVEDARRAATPEAPAGASSRLPGRPRRRVRPRTDRLTTRVQPRRRLGSGTKA